MISIRFLVSAVLLLAQGIFQALRSVQTLEELEERIQQLVQKAAGQILTETLNTIDKQLCAQRDRQKLRDIGFRSRTLLSTFGEINFRRRLYQDQETKEYVFLLDQALGLEPSQRLSPRLKRVIVELAAEMSFRRVAQILAKLVSGVSLTAIWAIVQKTGQQLAEQAQWLRESVFEHGEVPAGTKKIAELFIEADGVLIRQQHSDHRHEEVKLVVAYEKKQGKPKKLINRQTVAGVLGDEIWEEASAVFGQKWDLSEIQEVKIGGDGAAWIKNGLQTFPQATYHLDPFHLRRHLTSALAFSVKEYQAVTTAIASLERDKVIAALNQAAKAAPGKAARARVKGLGTYLLQNWEGIATLPEEQRLGAIEGQVRHTIARRMKRVGARWSPAGTDRMVRLLAARVNGQLAQLEYTRETKTNILKSALGSKPVETPPSRQDLEAWLKASIPALRGPSAGQIWVKEVLRQLATVNWSA